MLQKKEFTLSDFYGLLQIMDMKLNKLISSPNKKHTKLAADLQDHMNTRKKQLIENPLMRCAMFLDPRYKFDIDCDNELLIFVKMTLEKVWQRIKSVKYVEQTSEEPQRNQVQNKSLDNMDDLFAELDAEYNAKLKKNGAIDENLSPCHPNFSKEFSDIAETIHQYENFVSGSRMKSSDSVHTFWEQNKSTFGLELYEIASTIFAIPPTQSSVERFFSALKYLFNDYRYNLAEDLLESCLLIHLNSDFYETVKKQDIISVIEKH